jgi:hypothetical protein
VNIYEYQQLLAEKSALKDILTNIPIEDVLDRSSFEGRLGEVETKLAGYVPDIRQPAKARLLFRGRPVVGNHGIFAEFAMAASKTFTDAVTMNAASLGGRTLSNSGRIPDRDQNQLLITNTAVGSFGFEFEEYQNDQRVSEEESAVAQALSQTQALLEGSAIGSDDDLAEAATGTEPRVIESVRKFLDTLILNDAYCSFEINGKVFRFNDVGQVRRSWQRLSLDNLKEDTVICEGEFQGVLPKRRTFEFNLSATREIIVGKIGPCIADPDSINKHLRTKTTIELRVTSVGVGRKRYMLNQLPQF